MWYTLEDYSYGFWSVGGLGYFWWFYWQTGTGTLNRIWIMLGVFAKLYFRNPGLDHHQSLIPNSLLSPAPCCGLLPLSIQDASFRGMLYKCLPCLITEQYSIQWHQSSYVGLLLISRRGIWSLDPRIFKVDLVTSIISLLTSCTGFSLFFFLF